MRKIIGLILLAGLLVALASCGAEPEQPPVTTTLMIYMVGSDLEPKAGAASNDLDEIAGSGIDTRYCNVVVFAGGSPLWHNDVVGENPCSLLELGPDGFQLIKTEESVSMGNAQTLSDFLNFAYTNYPAQRYSLILWDHGNGPVMGYGKDLLYENDALLLTEMQQAMENSPFGEHNKLSWVGFDACLMASAELACVWDDYADYLIASQEVEPAFGWDYRAFGGIISADPTIFLKQLTTDYLAACQTYYDEKGYSHRDTTLSCLDLSLAKDLEAAIDNLFSRAYLDVEQGYGQLAVQRVQTRGLGRASTGSEYDLVDLGDLAVQFSSSYPQEAEKLQQVLDAMVLYNATNAQLCSGLSLYYPFYNKHYYQNSWGALYDQLNVLPTYHQYLQAYQNIWQKSSESQLFTSGVTPEAGGGNSYYLQLTPEQAANFASARFRILDQQAEDLYVSIFTSTDVVLEDNTLIANFDGNVIYIKNKYGSRYIPEIQHTDTVGELSRYTLRCILNNRIAGIHSAPLGVEHQYQVANFHITYDRSTKDVHLNSVLPFYPDATAEINSGKAEEIDLSQWSGLMILHFNHSWLTRNEAGVLLPFSQWRLQNAADGEYLYFTDELSYVCEPLTGGNYYLMIEVQDIYGNYSASELLPITTADVQQPVYEPAHSQITWDQGERVLLKDQAGLRIYMTSVPVADHTEFTIELENSNDFPMYLELSDLICNDVIFCGEISDTLVPANSTVGIGDYLDLGIGRTVGDILQLESLQLQLTARSAVTGEALIEPEIFTVKIQESTVIDPSVPVFRATSVLPYTFLKAHAEKQTIFENDSLRVTLLAFGSEKEGADCTGFFRLENLTDHDISVTMPGVTINGQHLARQTRFGVLPAGQTIYAKFDLPDYYMDTTGITKISQITFPIQLYHSQHTFFGFPELFWGDVVLDQKAPAEPANITEGTVVLYDQNGIRITLDPQPEESYSSTTWQITLQNNSAYDIQAAAILNTGSHIAYFDSLLAGAGQYCFGKLTCYAPLADIETLSFTVQILDFQGGKILFTAEEPVAFIPKA